MGGFRDVEVAAAVLAKSNPSIGGRRQRLVSTLRPGSDAEPHLDQVHPQCRGRCEMRLDSGVSYHARRLLTVCREVENLRAILAEHPTAPWPDKVEP
jgi:hypothetical protein